MFNSKLVLWALELFGDRFEYNKPLIKECREHHIEIIRYHLDMWKDLDGSDESFVLHFETCFPQGFLRRDLSRAKDIIWDLHDIAQSSVLRLEITPIYTYVMYHLILDYYGVMNDFDIKVDIPMGLKESLDKINISEDEVDDIFAWFTDGDTCAEDFGDVYNADFTSQGFAEEIASIYLYETSSEAMFKLLDVTIDEFFDLLPNDLRTQCVEKFKKEQYNLKKECASMNYDFFISHATEDKTTVAEPLAKALEALGAKVWLDKNEITIGDSLKESIEYGLLNSRRGVVILSNVFFEKYWTKKELNAMFIKATNSGKVILPVRHGMTTDEIAKRSILLADVFSLSTEEYSIDEIAKQIMNAN